MDAFEINLNDIFDASKPGIYRLHLAFTKESGVAEGTFRELTFQVGETRPITNRDEGDQSFE
jgi:hypothetical protein